MSGHSKWATIKRKKALIDAKKGAIFTKIAKNIEIASRKGKDIEMNPALRTAVEQARSYNMPKDSIEKAILKGAGELPGVKYEEIVYEGYGPEGVALIIETVTDNSNRTISELRHIISKHGGSFAQSGSVRYMFQQRGVIRLASEDLKSINFDDISLQIIDNGAEDILQEKEGVTIYTLREKLTSITEILNNAGLKIASSQIEWVTKNSVTLTENVVKKIMALIEELENSQDVNNVYTNVQNL